MSVGRAVYILLFPLVLTVAGLVLALVTFFGSYEHATGLRNVHFMTLDLSDISLGGLDASNILTSANVSTFYSIGTNGWCTGDSRGNMKQCYTPHEPFYFSIDEVLEQAGLGTLVSSLPSDVQKYSSLSKDVTLAVWGCFLATICLVFIQLIFGFFGMCSNVSGCCAEIFATLAFLTAALGAALATGVYDVYTQKINQAVGELGIKATLDTTGLGLAWATAAALLLADILYVLASCCCVSSRRTPRSYESVPEKYPYA